MLPVLHRRQHRRHLIRRLRRQNPGGVSGLTLARQRQEQRIGMAESLFVLCGAIGGGKDDLRRSRHGAPARLTPLLFRFRLPGFLPKSHQSRRQIHPALGVEVHHGSDVVSHRLRIHPAAVDLLQSVFGLLDLARMEIRVRQNGPRPILSPRRGHGKRADQQRRGVIAPGVIALDAVQIPLSQGNGLFIILAFRIADKQGVRRVNVGKRGIRKLLHGLIRPLLQLRQILRGGPDHGMAENSRAEQLPLKQLPLHALQGLPDISLIGGTPVGTLHALEHNLQLIRLLLQLFPEQLHIPPPLFLPLLRGDLHITVMVQNRLSQPMNRARVSPGLMDRAAVPLAGGHAHHAHRQEIPALPVQIRRGVVPDEDPAERIDPPPAVAQKFHQLGDLLIQPLVRVHRKKPLAGAAVDHRVPGCGKVVNPGKVKHNVGIFFRHSPASVAGAGIRHHQLAGNRLSQRLQGLHAPLQAADLILKDHSN